MTSEHDELRAAYAAGIDAARHGQSPDSQPYGKSVRGLVTKKITAWFLGYIDGQSAIRRCGTVATE